jgi:hypothetical protein
MSDHEQPEDVGASTERFEAFVRQGQETEREPQRNTFRVVTLLAGLVVLAAVIWLLLR